MSPLEKIFITRRIRDLEQYLDELKPYLAIGIEKYLKNREKRYIVERLIQLIVEVASDINRNIIENEQSASADTYYDSFTKLVELKVLPERLAVRLASTTGLRNRLVHRYEDVEHAVVFHSAIRMLENFRRYIRFVHKYVKSLK
ncbi:MAG: DUF86 domain-containing protein [Chloroflexi bacterium]|nr:DUF86 domain-containing protein [Chloroflexota bacterium]